MNKYFDNSTGAWQELDIFNTTTLERGKDFYIDVFRNIESEGLLTGLIFYISELAPLSLPIVDKSVVLLLVADETYQFKPYFAAIGCVLRTYGAFPQFKEGIPISRIKALSFIHFLYKVSGVLASLINCSLKTRDLLYFRVAARIMHVPLSCFFRFSPTYHSIKDRSIDYAFLGSISYDRRRKNWLHNFLTPPKLASRLEMIENMRLFQDRSGLKFKIHTTGDFEESIKNRNEYVLTLEDSKISLCPRGSNYETYRFFESLKTGTVIVCEHLPNAWFYQNHPGIVISSWARLPDLLEKLTSEPETLQLLSDRALAHWNSLLSEGAVAKRIAEFVRQAGGR